MSTHSRGLSQESVLTSLSSDDVALDVDASFSSASSHISARSIEFLNNVTTIIESSKALSDLVDRAEKLIAKLASHEEYNRLPYGSPDTKIKLDRVLGAMLSKAYACGGESGKRYTAAAICACRSDEKEATLKYLQSLGTTWVSHLLFVFQANGSHNIQQNSTPSEYATPTLDRTTTQIVAGVPENRASEFKDMLLKRDGYRCVATGVADVNYPSESDPGQSNMEPLFTTNGCHILRRAFVVFDASKPNSKASLSAFSTLDILSHYASLPEDTITEIASLIDDPSNGMILGWDVHQGFDRFAWSLEEVPEAPNTYDVKIHSRLHGFRQSPPRITFTDSSARYLGPSSPPCKKKRTTRSGNVGKEAEEAPQGIALPNPLFIRIHAAIAGVLHMSGAAEELDLILNRPGARGAPGTILVGDDFEDVYKLGALRETLVMSMMQQMTVK